jgi:hypothetical protein
MVITAFRTLPSVRVPKHIYQGTDGETSPPCQQVSKGTELPRIPLLGNSVKSGARGHRSHFRWFPNVLLWERRLEAYLSCIVAEEGVDTKLRALCVLGIASSYTTSENSGHSHQDTSGPHEAHARSPGASSAILGLGSSLTIVIATDCG